MGITGSQLRRLDYDGENESRLTSSEGLEGGASMPKYVGDMIQGLAYDSMMILNYRV